MDISKVGIRILISFLACLLVAFAFAQVEPVGGFNPIPVGGGWVVTEIKNQTQDTVTIERVLESDVWTRNMNDGHGGIWHKNGVSQGGQEVPIPATSNYYARWKCEGTYEFRFEFQGQRLSTQTSKMLSKGHYG